MAVDRVDHVVDKAGVTGKEQAGKGCRMGCRNRIGLPRRGAEHALAALELVLRQKRLIAHAEVDRNAARNLPCVLRVVAGNFVAVVEVLARCLVELNQSAEQKIGHRAQVRGAGVELELPRLLILVVHVYLGQLAVKAEAEGVAAFHPCNVIGQGVVVTAEGGGRVVADVDERCSSAARAAAYAYLVDLVKAGCQMLTPRSLTLMPPASGPREASSIW